MINLSLDVDTFVMSSSSLKYLVPKSKHLIIIFKMFKIMINLFETINKRSDSYYALHFGTNYIDYTIACLSLLLD